MNAGSANMIWYTVQGHGAYKGTTGRGRKATEQTNVAHLIILPKGHYAMVSPAVKGLECQTDTIRWMG